MFINPSLFTQVFSIFIPDKHLDLLLFNINRGRLFIETYDEIFIPLFIYLYFEKNIYFKKISLSLLASLILLAFLSLWRIRVLISVIGIVFGAYFLKTKKVAVKSGLGLLGLFVIIGFISHIILLNTRDTSFINRLYSFQNKAEISTLDIRIRQTNEGLQMGLSDIFGVGLGNYYDNLSPFSQNPFSTNLKQIKNQEVVQEYVHNIFGLYAAESGVIGLIIFMIIILLFLYQDINTLRKNKSGVNKPLIFAFWLLFIYGFFNPPITGTYQVIFWGIRGLLI